MSRMARFVTAFLLIPAAAFAQATRDDAIRKMVAGDYQGAAQLLKPLAEDPGTPDATAQFLLAILYDFGQGVPRNVMGACGLYRQAAASGSPFSETAAALDRMLREDSPVPEHMCATGPWHQVPDVAFRLGADHTVHFTANRILIRYQGAEQQIGTGTSPGVVPLAPVYTPLDVTQPVRERRHFFQSFYWFPDKPATPSSWTLMWGLVEIVGSQYVHVAFDKNVTTVTGTRPPDASSVGQLVRVYVGTTGEAEWVVGDGPAPRRGLVTRREPR